MNIREGIDIRRDIESQQSQRLAAMLHRILPANAFYRNKFTEAGVPMDDAGRITEKNVTPDWLAKLPLTTKTELLSGTASDTPSRSAPFKIAANQTWERKRYIRFHRTSGTQGHPMPVLDTAEDWDGWMQAWDAVLDAAEITDQDIALLAFSFGPFIGFWSAFDAACRRGVLTIPGGAMTTQARLELLFDSQVTVLFCTPSYALHMAEIAAEQNLPLADSPVRRIIVAGEPGGSVPAIAGRIESAFGAKVIDHAGASEIGAWGFPDNAGSGLYVNERLFIPELISLDDQQRIPLSAVPRRSDLAGDSNGDANEEVRDANEGLSELVLTTLSRDGAPVIRYRTGDLVRAAIDDQGGPQHGFLFLIGGVLGRTDQMVIIRGVNVFPSSIESILREFPEVAEYRLTVFRQGEMDQLKIEAESSNMSLLEEIADRLQVRLGLRIDIQWAAPDSLPRFEAKGKRFIDARGDQTR